MCGANYVMVKTLRVVARAIRTYMYKLLGYAKTAVGHRSHAVINYKWPNVQHDQLVSSVLQSPPQYQFPKECWKPPPQNFSLLQQYHQLVLPVLEPPSKTVKREPLSECWKPPPQNFTLPQYTQHHQLVSSVLEPLPSDSVKVAGKHT